MRSTIKSAKTVDEAVRQGIKDLGLSLDSVEIEILEEPKTGFLGLIGSRDAIVKITEKEELTIAFQIRKKTLLKLKKSQKSLKNKRLQSVKEEQEKKQLLKRRNRINRYQKQKDRTVLSGKIQQRTAK